MADGIFHALRIIADFDLLQGIDAHQGQLLADPRRIGIDNLAEQKLGADGNNFTPHLNFS
jgi:hypothetical protein